MGPVRPPSSNDMTRASALLALHPVYSQKTPFRGLDFGRLWDALGARAVPQNISIYYTFCPSATSGPQKACSAFGADLLPTSNYIYSQKAPLLGALFWTLLAYLGTTAFPRYLCLGFWGSMAGTQCHRHPYSRFCTTFTPKKFYSGSWTLDVFGMSLGRGQCHKTLVFTTLSAHRPLPGHRKHVPPWGPVYSQNKTTFTPKNVYSGGSICGLCSPFLAPRPLPRYLCLGLMGSMTYKSTRFRPKLLHDHSFWGWLRTFQSSRH